MTWAPQKRDFCVAMDGSHAELDRDSAEEIIANAAKFTYAHFGVVTKNIDGPLSRYLADDVAVQYAEVMAGHHDYPREFDLLIWDAAAPAQAFRVMVRPVQIWEATQDTTTFDKLSAVLGGEL